MIDALPCVSVGEERREEREDLESSLQYIWKIVSNISKKSGARITVKKEPGRL